MTYTPQPIDVSGVKLSDEILSLVEQLSHNTHEIWAEGRIAEGWVHGKQYDGENKHHPCLIPYDQLPESEKEFDRSTSINVIKAMILLGAEISFPNKD